MSTCHLRHTSPIRYYVNNDMLHYFLISCIESSIVFDGFFTLRNVIKGDCVFRAGLRIPEVAMPKEDGSTQAPKGLSRRSFLRNSAIVAASLPLASLISVPRAYSAEATQKAVAKAKSLMVERANCTGCHSCDMR